MTRPQIKKRVLLLIFVGGVALSTFAEDLVTLRITDTQYWVSIGQFDQRAEAEDVSNSAQSTLREDFTVLGTTTDSGLIYRVTAGPYLTRSLAEDRVKFAQSAGYKDARLWIDRSGIGSDRPELERFDPFDENAGPSAEIEARDAQLIRDKQPLPKLVDEAPEGYQLNQLHRER